MSSTATLPHPDRLTRERPAAPAAEVELAVEQLASLMGETHRDHVEALEAVARAATRLARSRQREVGHDEERPVAAAGSWSLDNGMLDAVLGEG